MPEVKDQLAALLARQMVMEAVLSTLIIRLSQLHPENAEFVRTVMAPVEDGLRQTVREAPADKREFAKAVLDYFEQLSLGVAAMLPHQGKH